MQGTNMALYRELLTIPGIEVTASGGIAAMAELAELSAMHCHAAILGSRFIRERLIWPRP